MIGNGRASVNVVDVYRRASEGGWKDNLSVSLEVINPEQAKVYLQQNQCNYRKKDQKHISVLSRDMRNGRWKFNSDTIAFDVDGILTDGQHRLYAIVDSGARGLEFLVVRGMPAGSGDDASKDTGKRRSVATHLQNQGVSSAISVAATARLLLAIRDGASNRMKAAFSDTEISEMVLQNRSIQEATDATSVCKFVVKHSAAAAWYWIACTEDSDLAAECVQILGGTIESVTSHPFAKCREVFLSLRANKASRDVPTDLLLRYLMSAWQKAKRGESIKLLRPVKTLEIPDSADAALAQL